MYFYGTVLTLAALTAGISALPPRSITARNTSDDVTAAQDGQASEESINGRNCLSLGCLPTLIETGTSIIDTHHHIPLSDPLFRLRRSRRAGKFEFFAVQCHRIK
ncbi:hypothetical protein K503DRAFT_86213 [Rhizopogon vinicolor AM-OR11-026]|uniref:Uncharacterized protein n=1 Tax=Rhizopogon vinicolor AM-OR11-026 TaxID=1314800 RepID=A0A1B7N3K0_9AGAM|nr:hypothetical protein K503DRAFT_86213 [Rhizopogon vinicolor AM-OR11-026]